MQPKHISHQIFRSQTQSHTTQTVDYDVKDISNCLIKKDLGALTFPKGG
jgi:hypothetical protein